MRLLFEFIESRLPVGDSIGLNAHEADVRGGTEKALLKILTESVVDGQRDDERCDTGGDSNDGDGGDDADDSLAAFGSKISCGDEKFEAHERESVTAKTLYKQEGENSGRWAVGSVQ
jgi:hypothetical protein